jgi:hypothetical protein
MAARKKETTKSKAKRGAAKLQAALRRAAGSLNGKVKAAAAKPRTQRPVKLAPLVEPSPARATAKRARRPSQPALPKRRRGTAAASTAGGGVAVPRRSR